MFIERYRLNALLLPNLSDIYNTALRSGQCFTGRNNSLLVKKLVLKVEVGGLGGLTLFPLFPDRELRGGGPAQLYLP